MRSKAIVSILLTLTLVALSLSGPVEALGEVGATKGRLQLEDASDDLINLGPEIASEERNDFNDSRFRLRKRGPLAPAFVSFGMGFAVFLGVTGAGISLWRFWVTTLHPASYAARVIDPTLSYLLPRDLWIC
jgi:hypothetical protein